MIISKTVYIQPKNNNKQNFNITTCKLEPIAHIIQFLRIQDFPSHVLSSILKF